MHFNVLLERCFSLIHCFIINPELRDSNAQEIDELKKQLQSVRSQLEIQKSSVASSSDQKNAIDELNSQLAETKRVNEEFKKEKASLESQVEQLKVELENKG